MPEGDTIYRAAATLARALTGETVREFETPLVRVASAAENLQVVGRTIENVTARGKFLLVELSGGITLLSHARMNGSWHIYRRGERWKAPRSAMRARIATDHWEAVGFSLPIVELHDRRSLARSPHLQRLGPDPLANAFDPDQALARLRGDLSAGAAGGQQRGDRRARTANYSNTSATPAPSALSISETSAPVSVADALLDQRRIAGLGNVLKSEALFLAGVYPFTPISQLDDDDLRRLIEISHRLLRANVITADRPRATARAAGRNTTGSSDPSAKLWVYGRSGRACRRCGSTIRFRRAGPHARGTYWCPGCQKET